jgi:phosphoadenosine phosphosulfate reductase
MIEADELAEAATRLAAAPAEEILAWATWRFQGSIALTLSFGGPGVALAHMLAAIDRSVPVIFIDTGYLFAETLAFQKAFAERYGLHVVTIRPATDPGPLYLTDPDRCCAIRKVEPMRRVLPTYDAWVSGVRRDQSATRRDAGVVERHVSDGHVVVKVHPLATWTSETVERYAVAHALPSHPLVTRGYTSIGCWPCTRPTVAGEDERAGRWSGTQKTECGLHTFTARTDE